MKISIKAFLKRSENVKIYIYHGTNPENVQKILNGGFDLTKINSRWINGYGVACFNKEDGVRKHFRNKDISIIQMIFEGNLVDSWYAEEAIKNKIKAQGKNDWMSPRDYNETLIENGIDAVITDSIFKGIKEIMVYNLGKIRQLRLLI
jgi:hypothetical protein